MFYQMTLKYSGLTGALLNFMSHFEPSILFDGFNLAKHIGHCCTDHYYD